MNGERAGIQLTEITVDENTRADEKDTGQQPEHDLGSSGVGDPFAAGRLCRRRRTWRPFLYGNALGVSPQTLESVVLTGIMPENVNDDVSIIHQHPLR